ncbi:Pectate lyase superfamily protein [Roseimaritima multifibrata]|uniref:Pectate lyase superfamily protein n=2 Tax=Roseimaritima multifibrata TaxID=1930274 RepID=A0A517MJB7_9BACT|nr:Pectate lyase superfamily protein [Roseimaritima multifibrata]
MRFRMPLLGCLILVGFSFGADLSPPLIAEETGKTVRDFGAIGDGVADDTAAVLAAVKSQPGDLVFPAGTYKLSQTIEISLAEVGRFSVRGEGAARVLMSGPGAAFRIVGTHTGTAAPSSFKPGIFEQQNTPLVDNLEIVGKHPDAVGVQAVGTMQLTVTRLVVSDCLHAVQLIKRNRNVTLSECHFYRNRGIGLFLDRLNLHQINVVNCHISYNAGGGIVVRDSELRNLQIGSCDIEGNMGDLSAPETANVLIDATGTSIGEVAIVGCTIQHTHSAANSANIRILGESKAVSFTDERRHGNITIADNILSDVQRNIELVGCRGVTISGNTIWKGYDRNVLLKDCKSVVMSGNLLDRNPRYGYGDAKDAKLGVLFDSCQNCTVSGNQSSGPVYQAAAWEFRDCDRIHVHGCTVLDYATQGVLFQETTRSQLEGCMIRDDANENAGDPVVWENR